MKKRTTTTELIYKGSRFSVEAIKAPNGKCPAKIWLEKLSQLEQAKFAALFVRLADHGKIFNERKFKHLSGTNKLFEFKVGSSRIISFFGVGHRFFLTHGFSKRAQKIQRCEINRAEIIRDTFVKREYR